MKASEAMKSEEFGEMVERMADTVLKGRLRQPERRARTADTLYLYDSAGSVMKIRCSVGPLADRPQVVKSRIADHRAVAAVLVTESASHVTENRNTPVFRQLSVLGMWPLEGMTCAYAWQIRWGKHGWALQMELGNVQELHGVWLWRLLPN
jgi:hypothetical protein